MNNLNRTWDEKRDFIRMKVNTEITLSLNDSDRNVVGYCRDLSGTVMLIEVDEEIVTGDTCQTSLPSASNTFSSLDATLKILRCIQVSDNKYQLGTEIVEIESHQQ